MRRLLAEVAGLVLAVAALAVAVPSPAAAVPAGFVHDPAFTTGLNTPTAFALAPDGRIFVTEKGGAIRVVLPDGTLVAQPMAVLAVNTTSERGLLGIALHPQFASNGLLYVYATMPGSPFANEIWRLTAAGNVAAGPPQLLETLDPHSAGNHNGGAVHFGPDGYLYVATGDNNDLTTSQNLASRHGKILRYDDAGNPVPGPLGTGIFALGLRNPYTFAFGPGPSVTGFVNDVGAGAREEISVLQANANYGWPRFEGTVAGPNPGIALGGGDLVAPVYDYPWTAGGAITGGAVYTATAFPVEYQGDYFFADFGEGWIDRRDAQTGTVTRFEPAAGSPVDLLSHPDGSLLYLSIAGAIGRITYPAGPVPPPPPPPPPAPFESIDPVRLVDTRIGQGGTRLVAGVPLAIPLAGPVVGAAATAVAVNLTADGAGADGFLTAWPCGQAAPSTSTLNYVAGAPAAAGALVGLGDGALCVRAFTDTDLIVDVSGWFGPGAAGTYAPIVNQRLLDTRTGPPLAAATERTVTAAPAGATAVVVNLTATETAADGYLTAYPCTPTRPTVSNLNVRAGETRANLAVVPVAADGTICVFSFGGGHVVVDAVGVFGGPGATGSQFQPLTPSRLLDTRLLGPRVAAGAEVRVPAPAGASAVSLSVVATQPTSDGYLTVYPCGETTPTASTVNYGAGETIANGAVSRVGAGGEVCVFTYAASHVVVDLTGTFA